MLVGTEKTVQVVEGPWEPASVARAIVAGGLQEDPFYVLDLGEVVARFRKWKDLLPRVEPFYAVKCNDDSLLVRTLAALGAGFDCASKAEIELVSSLGVRPERIIFANPAKMASHIRHAAAAGAHTTTFDSETELMKIKELMPHAKLVLRIRCDARDGFCLGVKYGCDAASEAPALLATATKMGLEVIGVSFHIGSNTSECEAYARGIRAARSVFDAARAAGLELTLLDIGGGFPGRSSRGIEEHAAIINETLAVEFPEQAVRVIAEPGRYFATAPFTLAVMVHSKRQVNDDATGEAHSQYYINDGIYGSFLEVVFNQTYHPELLKPNSAESKACSIWGPTCDGLDCVVPSTCLPPLDVGEWMVFRDMGAYTRALSTRFNGFEVARVTAVVDSKLWPMLEGLPLFAATQFVRPSSAAQKTPNGLADSIITSAQHNQVSWSQTKD